ncbi:MAG: PQQ-binding-like beta-propeller repeat protein, partial [Candidatus Bathyarchaeota archaeon]|nr:PQQ-binding-like beta-propeller repeat protein [Candidatus Bathyarchaeota archaeon]
GEDALTGSSSTFSCAVGPGVFCIFQQETMQYHGYDIDTGEELWITEPYDNAWGSYQTTIGDGPAYIAYDRLYTAPYDGTLHCYDISNGDDLWHSFVGSSGLETPYGTWPLWGSMLIADYKVYAGTGEHSPNQPMPRGEQFLCFDAMSGDIIWSIDGFMMNPIIADGYLVTFNSYDMQNYCFGKGQTLTTVTAPMTSVPKGNGVVIQGTVLDQSPGAKDTPAISDEDMTEWMEYIYMDKPKPEDVVGVPVDLVAITPGGEEITIGTVYGDDLGHYACAWTPESEGMYTIIATFKGSDSYFGSSAKTAFTVGSPAATSSETANQVVSQLGFTTVDIVLLVGIVVIAVLVVYMLLVVKKQK